MVKCFKKVSCSGNNGLPLTGLEWLLLLAIPRLLVQCINHLTRLPHLKTWSQCVKLFSSITSITISIYLILVYNMLNWICSSEFYHVWHNISIMNSLNYIYVGFCGKVVRVVDLESLAPCCWGLESRQSLLILSCEEAIQLAYRMLMVLLRCLLVPE